MIDWLVHQSARAHPFHSFHQAKHQALLPPGAPLSNPSLYPLLQLLLPKTDSRSGQYKVLEKTVAQ